VRGGGLGAEEGVAAAALQISNCRCCLLLLLRHCRQRKSLQICGGNDFGRETAQRIGLPERKQKKERAGKKTPSQSVICGLTHNQVAMQIGQ